MHDQASWQRLGLSEEEWRECQLAAVEMSVAARAAVTPHQVAVEFALARAFEEDLTLSMRGDPHGRRARSQPLAQR